MDDCESHSTRSRIKYAKHRILFFSDDSTVSYQAHSVWPCDPNYRCTTISISDCKNGKSSANPNANTEREIEWLCTEMKLKCDAISYFRSYFLITAPPQQWHSSVFCHMDLLHLFHWPRLFAIERASICKDAVCLSIFFFLSAFPFLRVVGVFFLSLARSLNSLPLYSYAITIFPSHWKLYGCALGIFNFCFYLSCGSCCLCDHLCTWNAKELQSKWAASNKHCVYYLTREVHSIFHFDGEKNRFSLSFC